MPWNPNRGALNPGAAQQMPQFQMMPPTTPGYQPPQYRPQAAPDARPGITSPPNGLGGPIDPYAAYQNPAAGNAGGIGAVMAQMNAANVPAAGGPSPYSNPAMQYYQGPGAPLQGRSLGNHAIPPPPPPPAGQPLGGLGDQPGTGTPGGANRPVIPDYVPQGNPATWTWQQRYDESRRWEQWARTQPPGPLSRPDWYVSATTQAPAPTGDDMTPGGNQPAGDDMTPGGNQPPPNNPPPNTPPPTTPPPPRYEAGTMGKTWKGKDKATVVGAREQRQEARTKTRGEGSLENRTRMSREWDRRFAKEPNRPKPPWYVAAAG